LILGYNVLMRVRRKSVDGLRKSTGRSDAVTPVEHGLKWYWHKFKWWFGAKWLDVKSESVKIEERGITGWERWRFGFAKTHDDFYFLLTRLAQVLRDGSIGFSEKALVLVRGFKSSVISHQGRFRSIAGFMLFIFATSLISAGMLSYVSIFWGLSEGFVRAAESGLNNVKSGVEALKQEDFSEASFNFAQAEHNFSEIKRDLQNFGQGENFLDGTLAGNEYDNVIYLVDGLQSTARGAKFAVAAIATIEEYAGEDIAQVFFGVMNGEEGEILTVIDQAGEYLEKSNSEIQQALMYFGEIDETRIPADYREIYREAMSDADRYLNILQGINAIFANADSLLGRHYPTQYLLLFQNNNEIRPTGGFIGSYGIAEFNDGVMTELRFDDVYNPDGQILEEIEPPYPINLMTDQWGIRDSNWDPDFVYSAQRAALFYEKSGGATVDGVFAFTPDIVQRFLSLTGPVELPDYEVVLTADNFQAEIQREIEVDAIEEAQPKRILAELLPILMERLADLPAENKTQLWGEMLDLLYEKHILLYLSDDEVERLFQEIGWTGEMVAVAEEVDYLSLIHANIGGRKSDGFVSETVNHQVDIDSAGNIEVEVEIIKKNGDDWSKFNHANFDYLRVYVPLGSELMAVDGFAHRDGVYRDEEGAIWYDVTAGEATLTSTDVYEEYGKTVFANWIVTNPWEVSVVKYRYRLPFKVGDWFADEGDYQLYVQKQSGRREVDYNFTLRAQEWVIVDNNGQVQNDWSSANEMLTDWQVKFGLKKNWQSS